MKALTSTFKTRSLALFAALATLLCALALTATPLVAHATTVASGTCGADGADLTWTLDDQGTLAIDGSGAMLDNRIPWYSYRNDIKKVTISAGVTSISNFGECPSLETVTFANGSQCQSIGKMAFRLCTSLTSISLPSSVESIGAQAFDGCESLRSINLPAEITTIETGVFSNCSSLTTINIPSSVKAIGGKAFSGCSSLRTVTFLGNSQCTSIGACAFFCCTALPSFDIPATVTSIGIWAFAGCSSFISVTIPASVTFIGEGPFSGCTSLEAIKVSAGNTSYSTDGRSLVSSAGQLLAYANGSGSTYTVPASVTAICDSAFACCTSLTSVIIPASVVSIGDTATATSGMNISSEGLVAMSGFGYYGGTFRDCTSLASVKFESGSKCSTICKASFAGCSALSSVYLPLAVTSIAQYVFEGCESLSSVLYEGSESDRAVITIGESNSPLTTAEWRYGCDFSKPSMMFTDLDADAWFMQPTAALSDGTLYLDFVLERSIMSGYSGTASFGPYDQVTRAQFATMLYRYACSQDSSLEATYGSTTNSKKFAKVNTTGLSDVEENVYYTAAVNWAMENGVITGYKGDDGSYVAFGPDDKISREQLCTMVRRFCVDYLGRTDTQAQLSFDDAGAISDWARAGVAFCKAKGVVSGIGGPNRFDPQDDAQRCAAAKMMAVMVHDVVEG